MNGFFTTQRALASSGLALIALGIFFFAGGPTFVYERTPPEVVAPRPIRIVAVGDIMLDRSIRSVANTYFEGSYDPFFVELKKFAQGSVLFGNLEGPISDKGSKRGSIYSFRMSPSALEALKNTGFSVLSFANNHIGDFGQEAYDDTILRAKNEGLPLIGIVPTPNASQLVITTQGGVRIGWLGYTDVGPAWMAPTDTHHGVGLLDEAQLVKDITVAQPQVDMLIISLHWGNEYETRANAHQRDIAHSAIDAGADVILGHHPHVAQEIEEYNGGVIAYSLGNFVFDQNFSADTHFGLVLEIMRDPSGDLSQRTHRAVFDAKYVPHIEPYVSS